MEEAREIHLRAEIRKCEEAINKQWAERIRRNDEEWAERIANERRNQQENLRATIVSMCTALNADRDYILGRLVEWGGLDQTQAEAYLENALRERAAADRE